MPGTYNLGYNRIDSSENINQRDIMIVTEIINKIFIIEIFRVIPYRG